MKGYTIQKSIDLLEKEIEKGGTGAGDASDISYDNTGSGLTADNVQTAIDEIAERDASDISYDNTGSGLTADDVQSAIDEIAERDAADISYDNTTSGLSASNVQTAIDELTSRDIVSTTETKIGKWGNDDLYQKILTGSIGKSDSVTISFADGTIKNIYGYFTNALNDINFPLNANWTGPSMEGALFDASHIYLASSAAIGADSSYTVVVQYTKAAVSNTRKKK